jgi:hypothetical protein
MPRPTGKLLERPLGVFVPLASMRMSSASRVNGQFAVALAHFPGSGPESGPEPRHRPHHDAVPRDHGQPARHLGPARLVHPHRPLPSRRRPRHTHDRLGAAAPTSRHKLNQTPLCRSAPAPQTKRPRHSHHQPGYQQPDARVRRSPAANPPADQQQPAEAPRHSDHAELPHATSATKYAPNEYVTPPAVCDTDKGKRDRLRRRSALLHRLAPALRIEWSWAGRS